MITVILVEDEEHLRREIALTTPWQDLGCTLVGEAANGTVGLELILKIRPQLVITDVRMPGMDGLAMLSEADRRLGTDRPAAILLTGYSDFEYARKALRLGVREYILKPVDDEDFHRLVSEISQDLMEKREMNRTSQNLRIMEGSLLASFREYGFPAAGDNKDEYIRQCTDFIKTSYIRDISIQDAAEELGITQGYLSRIFKERTAYTFLEYLTCVRLRQALRLLSDKSMRINEIARESGFQDHGYFTQLFRKYMGVTPREYRNGTPRES